MNSNQNSFNPNSTCKDCKDYMNRLLETMPFFIKIIIFSTIILYLLNLFIPYIAYFLSDIPYLTLYRFQIWRLITTSFMTTGILGIIFSLILWYKDAVKLEKELGTVKYMLIFFMNTLCIQILYCLITFLLSLIIQNKAVMTMKISGEGIRNEGIWPILMCDLTLLCLNNPEAPMRFFILPCVFKAKYYPLILFLVFTVISGFFVDFEIMCAIGFGFLYHYYLKNILKISNSFALKVENSFLCKWMKNKKGFVNIGGGVLPELKNNLENVIRNVNVSGNRNINSQNGFSAFRGKGIAVGGSTNSNNNRANVGIANSEPSSDSRNETTDYNNVSVGSNGDLRSNDSRMDLNSSVPKS